MNFLEEKFPPFPFRDFRFWLIQAVNVGILIYILILNVNSEDIGFLASPHQDPGAVQIFVLVYLITTIESALLFGPKSTMATILIASIFIIPRATDWLDSAHGRLALARLAVISLLAIGTSIMVSRERSAQRHLRELNEVLKENILEKERYIKLAGQAQENERRRISRDLHDDSLQLLANVTSQINEAIESKDPVRARVNMMRAKETIALTSETIRRYCEELRPLLLESMGLIPSVEWLGRELEERTGISVRFVTHEAGERLDSQKEIHIFRVIQEAFNNIERHSQATKVDVLWDFKGGNLVISVKDNGIGMWNFGPAPARSLGIQGMYERVELVGGKLTIESQPGFGTKILLTVPIA